MKQRRNFIQTMRMLDKDQSNMVAKIRHIRPTGYALVLHYHRNLFLRNPNAI